MTAALIIVLIVILMCIVYLLCLRGRANHPGLAELRRWKYAHRGLHDDQKPENSMAAFAAALEAGYGIELDVHLLKDGNLAVMHDSVLKRTTGAEGKIEDLTTGQLTDYKLGGTEETIPQFRQVLNLFSGKAPMIVELKPEKGNHAALCKAACEMMDTYKGPFCMESFDPRCVRWLRKNRPDIIRGQLSQNWIGISLPLPGILKWVMTYHLSTFYTKPDFIAYKYEDRKKFGTDICRKLWKIQGVSWTLRTKEEYDTAVKEGWIPIFENFRP